MNDLRFAFRQLLKNPGFTVVAVLTLALGLGANTVVFSVARTVLLRPLGFDGEDRLMWIRLANASPRVLLGLLFQAGHLALVGLVIGLCVSFATNRLLASQLFGLSPHDPFLLTMVSVLLLFVALLASFLPARRAAQVDPMEALRHE